MKTKRNFLKFCFLAALLLRTFTVAAQTTLTMLASFNGANPSAALTLGNDGNFYGTTPLGGINHQGAIFRVTTNGLLTTLVSFPYGYVGLPRTGLTLGNDGNFYGLTGGYASPASVFRATTNGVLTTLTTLGGQVELYAGLILGNDGNFYGTTVQSSQDAGTVFRVTTNGVLTALATFTNALAATTGEFPYGLILGNDGNLYGLTEAGGSNGHGTVFRLTTNGVLTTLSSLNSGFSYSPMTLGADGNFYGIAWDGGPDDGAIFRLTTSGILTTLTSSGGGNGAEPAAGLTLGADGNFYGTTEAGGSDNLGTVFQVSTNGILNTLFSFNSANGANPQAALALGNDGNLYGTTYSGGNFNDGTVFKLAIAGGQTFNYTTIDVPGATTAAGAGTSAEGISGTNIVGWYEDSSYVEHGFLYNGTSYATLTDPASVSGTYSLGTSAAGVSGGNVVGSYYPTNGSFGAEQGFFYNGAAWMTISAPLGVRGTYAGGIDGSNIVGSYIDSAYVYHGFLYQGGAFTTINNPLASSPYGTHAYGISGGNLVGSYYDSSYVSHGFLYNGSSYVTIDPPQTAYTFANGISGSNVVGTYEDYSGAYHGFIYNISTGAYTVLNDPLGVKGTAAWGIDGNNIVGSYTDTNGVEHGFITSLPGPPSPFTFGTTNLIEGSGGGLDGVVLAANAPQASWSATANASWLHLGSGLQNGTGSTNVIFSFDANSGPNRTGTLTIAGQTVTVTQAGSTYGAAPAPVTFLGSGGENTFGVAVDKAGNVYYTDYENTLRKWNITNNTVSILVNSGLNQPAGVAVDASGNVYIADAYNNAIKVWTAANNTVSTIVSNLDYPQGVALDASGNIYIADTYNQAVKEWVAASGSLITLVSSGLNNPTRVAVDAAGNVYIACGPLGTIFKWSAATKTVSTLVSAGLNDPYGLAVDGSGNVYIADQHNNTLMEWSVGNNTLRTLVSSGLSYPVDVAVDGSGNLFISDEVNNAIKELPRAFVDPTPKTEPLSGGSDSLPVVLPATENLLAPFAPTSDSPWLTITGVTNGVVSFSFTAGSNRVANINLLGQNIPVIQPIYTVGTTNLLEGPAGGEDTVIVAVTSVTPWTSSANATWLHAYGGGNGSGLAYLGFDGNPGPTRSGTLTIAGQTVTVTQAGSTYVPAPGPVTTLVPPGNQDLTALTVDHSGNVYFCDYIGKQLEEWTPTNNSVSILANSGVSAVGLALDAAGNVYIADYASDAIEKWTVATGNISTVVPNLNQPYGVAVDGMGNIYIADTYNNATEEWLAASNSLTTLVSSTYPEGVAVDAAGNVYVGNRFSTVQEWSAATKSVSTLVSGLNFANGVAVDGSGNVYIADVFNNAIREWSSASNNLVTLLSSGLNYPWRVAVDGADNLYFLDAYGLRELPHAFVDATPKIEPLSGGSDSLPMVLPATQNLQAPFAPTSDSPWLTITGVTNGVVSFSFTAGSNRVANINLLGQNIPVIQPIYNLGTTNLLEGPGAGCDSVIVAATSVATWSVSSLPSWIHFAELQGAAVNASGSPMGSGLYVFSYDANPGLTRTGTLTIAGKTLTVTQAGATYVQAPGPLTTLSTGLHQPVGMAMDNSGNVYFSSYGDSSIKKWTRADNTTTTVLNTNLNGPFALAVDAAGNIFIADTYNQMIKEWIAASNSLITLVSANLQYPSGLALDGAGNVYIADTYHSAIKEWVAASNLVVTLVSSGLDFPAGLAVDVAGNVYIVDNNNQAVKEWNVAGGLVTLIPSGSLNYPTGLAVDGSGNVYVVDTYNNVVLKRSAASGVVFTLIPAILNNPYGVAVDNVGNIYVADENNSAIKELPRAFIDPTPKTEIFGAGTDFLPSVLPATENLLPPFNPTSDQPWLTVNGSSAGVVNFSFALASTNRTGHLNVLGQSVPVSQVINVYNSTVTNGQFQFAFTNYVPNASYNVLSATSLNTPLTNWIEVAASFNMPTGYFQFTIPINQTNQGRFYRLHLIQ